MYTLVYIKNQFNRPDTLSNFLEAHIGESPLLRIDCISPYKGTEQDLVAEVCDYLSCINPRIQVFYSMTQNVSVEKTKDECLVNFLVMQIQIVSKTDN